MIISISRKKKYEKKMFEKAFFRFGAFIAPVAVFCVMAFMYFANMPSEITKDVKISLFIRAMRDVYSPLLVSIAHIFIYTLFLGFLRDFSFSWRRRIFILFSIFFIPILLFSIFFFVNVGTLLFWEFVAQEGRYVVFYNKSVTVEIEAMTTSCIQGMVDFLFDSISLMYLFWFIFSFVFVFRSIFPKRQN